jgi:hypothetical protein
MARDTLMDALWAGDLSRPLEAIHGHRDAAHYFDKGRIRRQEPASARRFCPGDLTCPAAGAGSQVMARRGPALPGW